MTQSLLELRDVTAGYGGVPVLRQISLSIAHNESVAIIGANGAGKSTLVRVIAGLVKASAGSVRKDGTEINALPAHQRTQLGIACVLEGRRLFGELSVQQHLQLAASYAAKQSGVRFQIDDVLRLFPFIRARLDARVELLSGGEQQMVAIARALLLQPTLLLMDEPSTGLAPKIVNEILGVIATLRESGMSIMLVEQNAALAAKATERGYVMSLGRIVHEIPPGEWAAFLQDDTLARSYLAG